MLQSCAGNVPAANPDPPTPGIGSLSVTSGPVGTAVTITGTNFGATQGTSTVKFNGTAGDADELECDEHRGAGAERERRRETWW